MDSYIYLRGIRPQLRFKSEELRPVISVVPDRADLLSTLLEKLAMCNESNPNFLIAFNELKELLKNYLELEIFSKKSVYLRREQPDFSQNQKDVLAESKKKLARLLMRTIDSFSKFEVLYIAFKQLCQELKISYFGSELLCFFRSRTLPFMIASRNSREFLPGIGFVLKKGQDGSSILYENSMIDMRVKLKSLEIHREGVIETRNVVLKRQKHFKFKDSSGFNIYCETTRWEKTYRLFKEAEFLQEIEHPNVMKCFSGLYYPRKKSEAIFDEHVFSMTEDTKCGILLEYADQGDLENFLKRHPITDEAEKEYLFISIARGISALHNKNIVHADIAARNIFIFSNPSAPYGYEVKIGDLNYAFREGFDYNIDGGQLAPEALIQEYFSGLCLNEPNFDIEKLKPGSEVMRKPLDIWAFGLMVARLNGFNTEYNQDSILEHKEILEYFNRDLNIFMSKQSPRLQELLRGCLDFNPRTRWTIEQVMRFLVA